MKSILFINYEYPPIGGGAATATYYFASEFASKGFKTTVLTSAFKEYHGVSEESKVTVFRIPALRKYIEKSSFVQMIFFIISAAIYLFRIVKKSDPDVLITFFSIPCGPVGLIAHVIWGFPYAVMLRGGDVPGSDSQLRLLHKLLQPLRRLVYQKSLAIIANSQGLKHLAQKADPEFTIHVIPNGVDTAFFSPEQLSSSTRNAPFIFLFAGRVCQQKNLGVLIKAFSMCLQYHPNTELVIAGDGPLLPQIKLFASTLNLDKKIRWTGWQSREKIKSLYLEVDCVVNPSLNEGMPNVVLEAMSCGRAVIASDCAGNSDLIVDKHNGFLFPADDHFELTKLMMLMINDRELNFKIGVRGREICCSQYSWAAAAKKLQSVIINNKS
ncbi:MAG TPA: glycosyltransferase family 4 protein [Chitinispirillaceae bacterium]|nr:glycosyltransferase family 4 protein [Chitinispirillaceae bacterium]